FAQPPTQVFGIEGRYASALYCAASKLKQLDAVEKDLGQIKDSLKKDKKLKEFIDNPTIGRGLKIKLTPPSANMLSLLAENGRLQKLDAVTAAFYTIMAAHRGDLKCEITTARPLDEETKRELTNALKSFAKKGENIILEMKVEPSIIGGMIVSIGDKYVDMSISSKIKKYTEIMQAAV
ncbi:hypothetical protein AAG570_010867, partial [Ranatra chinensis]